MIHKNYVLRAVYSFICLERDGDKQADGREKGEQAGRWYREKGEQAGT